MKLSVSLEWNGEEFIWVAESNGYCVQAKTPEQLKQRCDIAARFKRFEGDNLLPGGYRCEQCHATGPYPIDDTTPKRAFRILLDSCPQCQPYDEDSFRYVDMGGNELSILPGK